MKRSFIFVLLLLSGSAFAADVDSTDRLRQIISPHIVGNVLIVEGVVGSHIYDYLSLESKALESVEIIDLNSFGGNTEWGLEVARKIKSLGKVTRLTSGHYCASACSYLFAAGRERQASADTWIGIHGARLGAGYTTSFQGLCFVDLETGPVFEPKKAGCQKFLGDWYQLAMAQTTAAFDFMESNGVSPSLRQTYFAMPDDPEWPSELNVIRKPDWPMNAEVALTFNLVTKVIPLEAK